MRTPLRSLSSESKTGRCTANRSGFTLVELLVVVAIIAVLAAVGVVIFTNIQKGARDTKRRADINAIASAYESKFDSVKGEYSVLTDANFQSGKMPAPPENPTGSYRFIAGPNSSSPDSSLYRVCAELEGAAGLYCRSSSQGSATAATTGSCSNFKMPAPDGGTRDGIPGDTQSCYVTGNWVDRTQYTEVWIKCQDINSGTVNCTRGACAGPGFTNGVGPDDSTGNMFFYSSETATEVVANTLMLYSRPSDGRVDHCSGSRPWNNRNDRVTVHLRN